MKYRLLSFALLAAATAQVSADIVAYNTESSFLSAIRATYFLDDFPGWTYGSPLSGFTDYTSPTVNGYQWHASANNGPDDNYGMYSLGPTPGLAGITSYAFTEKITITFTGATVRAFGGIFSSTDVDGNIIPLVTRVSVNGGVPYIINGSGFLGFVSTDHLTQILEVVLQPINGPHCDNNQDCNSSEASHLYLGKEMPEPPTPALAAAGLAALGFSRRRAARRR